MREGKNLGERACTPVCLECTSSCASVRLYGLGPRVCVGVLHVV